MGMERLFAFLPNTPIARDRSRGCQGTVERLRASLRRELFKLGDTDFRGLVSRAKAFNPDAVLVWGHGTTDEGVIMRQARELGMMRQPMFSGSPNPAGKGYREAAGIRMEGFSSRLKYDRAAAKKLSGAYRAKLGVDPDFARAGGLRHGDDDRRRGLPRRLRRRGHPALLLAESRISRASAAAVQYGPDRQRKSQ